MTVEKPPCSAISAQAHRRALLALIDGLDHHRLAVMRRSSTGRTAWPSRRPRRRRA
ncbi:MAG: hypothetical protein ACRD0K_18755 [Egibacteraceae bacterium]